MTRKYSWINVEDLDKIKIIGGYLHILLSSIYLFNIRRQMEKILRIHLSWLKSLYVNYLYKMAQIAIFDKIIYDWEEMNQIKPVFREVR